METLLGISYGSAMFQYCLVPVFILAQVGDIQNIVDTLYSISFSDMNL